MKGEGLAGCGSVWPRLESYLAWPDASLRGLVSLVADVYGQTIFLIVWVSFGFKSGLLRVSQTVGFHGLIVVSETDGLHILNHSLHSWTAGLFRLTAGRNSLTAGLHILTPSLHSQTAGLLD